MRSGVIAQKVGMTRIFTDAGEHIPVTVLKLEKLQVLGHRTNDKNGYTALQLGAGTRKASRLTKSERESFAKVEVEPKRKLVEFRVSPENLIEVGAEITADHFVPGQFVDVTGTNQGKGFQGAMEHDPLGSEKRLNELQEGGGGRPRRDDGERRARRDRGDRGGDRGGERAAPEQA